MLITARISAVGIALRVANQNRNVAFINILVHQHRRAMALRYAKIHHMRRVLTVMGRQLAAVIKLIEQRLAQNLLHLRHSRTRVQAV